MKFILLALGFSLSVQAHALGTVPVSAAALFVPVGFDDNDDVVVTLDGYLPNGCYQLANVEVLRDIANSEIWVQQMAYRFDGPCIQVQVPFSSPVSLGTLPPGKFKVISHDGKLREELTVKAALQPGPDDFLYAPIDTARVASLLPEPGGLVVLEGRFTNTCLSITEVRVTRHGKTVEVLPLMEMTGTTPGGLPCEGKEVPFVKTARLPLLNSGRYLLHVRSLNGRSLNVCFTEESPIPR